MSDVVFLMYNTSEPSNTLQCDGLHMTGPATPSQNSTHLKISWLLNTEHSSRLVGVQTELEYVT